MTAKKTRFRWMRPGEFEEGCECENCVRNAAIGGTPYKNKRATRKKPVSRGKLIQFPVSASAIGGTRSAIGGTR